MDDFDLDPEAVRRLGYRAADLVADHRAGLLKRPVFGKVGDAAALFDEPLPEDGQPLEAVLDAVRDRVLAHPFGNSHPRFFAFINATADPVGTAADYLASAMNSNCWGGDHAAIHVERRVVAWLAEILGLPGDGRGHPHLGRLDGELHRPRDGPARHGPERARGRLRGHAAAGRLRLGRGPQLRGQGRRPPRHRLEAAAEDPDRRPLPRPRRPAEAGDRRRPAGRPEAGDRRRQRRHREHRRHRPARRAGRPLRRGGPLVPRGRGLRGAGLDLAEAEAALRGPRAGRLRRGRPAQVALRALRGRRHPRPRAGAHGRGVPPPRAVPRARPRQPGPRAGPLQRARAGAVARASRRSRCGWA